MKRLLETISMPFLRRLDPEDAHRLAIRGLQSGLTPTPGPKTSECLRINVAGLDLPNPVGLAAGFDKNAEAIAPLLQSGFGFVEIGAVTPRAQPGNPRPRLFRLTEDQAAINRFGFNNQGMDAVAARLERRTGSGVLGINLGANKDSEDRAADFASVLLRCGHLVDFATVNVSSPNTERLRDLQGKAALEALLARVMEARTGLATPIPIFLKIAPDLTDAELSDIAETAIAAGLSGIIATNTTLSREGLHSHYASETGGLSGQPLFERSTRVLAKLSQLTDGNLPLIGVGGIGSAGQAYAKILAGASAVQLYTALVYGGMSLVGDILSGLENLCRKDGYSNIAEAIGKNRKAFL